jgi:hypothetical protein
MDTNTEIIELLQTGKITVEGEFIWGSNYTFLVNAELEGKIVKAVYKPTRGERPLWDFPAASLAKREAAAYWVSQALGWELVPPTVYRKKAPIGAGSLQLYIEHDPNYHYFNFTEEDRQRLRPTVTFDLLINNADRKGSHILVDKDHHFWLIDHGVCFHVEDKLRTVIWDFVGEPIPEELISSLNQFLSTLQSGSNEGTTMISSLLEQYLTRGEIRALARRAQLLIHSGVFPGIPVDRRPYPWPAI